MYKPKYDPVFGDIEIQKKAHKLLKTSTSSEEWQNLPIKMVCNLKFVRWMVI